MSSNQKRPRWQEPSMTSSQADDEGGLRAPPGLTGWRKAWWWFDFIILVKLARLRFIAVLAVIGIVITQWDLLAAYYDKWTRPADAAAGPSGDVEWFCPMHPSVIRDNPRDKCPICFMPLSKRKKGDGARGSAAGRRGQSRAAFALSGGVGRRADLEDRVRAA